MKREIRVYKGEEFAGVFGEDDDAPGMPTEEAPRKPEFTLQMFEEDDEKAARDGEAHARKTALSCYRWKWPRNVTVSLATDGSVCITVPFAHDRLAPV